MRKLGLFQFAAICIMIAEVGLTYIHQGELRPYDMITTIVNNLLWFTLLYYGGFFEKHEYTLTIRFKKDDE